MGIFKSFKAIFKVLLIRILHLYKLDLVLRIREIIDPIINFDWLFFIILVILIKLLLSINFSKDYQWFLSRNYI